MRVRLQAQSLFEPGLQLSILRIDLIGHDAHGRPAVDPLESLQDGPQELLVFLRIAHVVDGENDDGLHAFLADPLRGDEPGERARDVVGIAFIEVGEPVAVGGCGDDRGEEQQSE